MMKLLQQRANITRGEKFMEIGAIIKKARNNAGLTQEQSAEALGVSRQTVSNWENAKSYPDIISVIKMSDLYSVSLDCLLKEETSVKQTYKEYLEESSNTVKSNDRKSKILLSLTTLGIWALSVLAFWLVQSSESAGGFSLAVVWGILPITFFAVSFIMGERNYFGKLKWICPVLFGVMHALSGYVSVILVGNTSYRQVMWPDFSKFPVGLIAGIAGIAIGMAVRNKKSDKA